MRELFSPRLRARLFLRQESSEDDAFTQGTFVLSACLLAHALLLMPGKRKEKQPADSLRISARLQSPCWRWSLLNPPQHGADERFNTSRSSYLESIPAHRELVARNEEKDSDFYR
ncbi:MAG: hypothetical protein ACLURV_13075 [Gallintestinimicrobium sp.]